MTEQVRYRLDKALLKEAKNVCDEIGLAPAQAVSLLFSQMVRLRGLPFKPSEFPALEEYGATPEDAARAIASARKEIAANRKAGRLVEFKGKIPA